MPIITELGSGHCKTAKEREGDIGGYPIPPEKLANTEIPCRSNAAARGLVPAKNESENNWSYDKMLID